MNMKFKRFASTSQCMGEKMCLHNTTAVGLSDRHNKVVLSSDGSIVLSSCAPHADASALRAHGSHAFKWVPLTLHKPFPPTTEPRSAGLIMNMNIR